MMTVGSRILLVLGSFLVSSLCWMPSKLTTRPQTSRHFLSQQVRQESLESLLDLPLLPKLVVLDLDNTLWTPELYQIRKKDIRANHDIHLFPDAIAILEFVAKHSLVALAVASRTSKMDTAQSLLDNFNILGNPLRNIFSHIHIRPGSKKQHFAQLREDTGLSYTEMLFLDDDARMNLDEISQLGVLCCHTPNGITIPLFIRSLEKYNQLKTGHEDNHWMGYILTHETLGIVTPQADDEQPTLQGCVKFFNGRFGFVSHGKQQQEYFVHESKVPAGINLQKGDIVSFRALPTVDPRRKASAVIISVDSSSNNTNGTTVSMPCFTMSQPFAALLLHGLKTVESRNNPMFSNVAPGTQVFLHVGQRDWHDTESYKSQLVDLDAQEVDHAARLPRGFGKGCIVGIVKVGRTWRKSRAAAEQNNLDLQRRVLAPLEDIGEYCTEIVYAQWLAKPVRTRGQPGIYTVDIPQDCLPRTDFHNDCR